MTINYLVTQMDIGKTRLQAQIKRLAACVMVVLFLVGNTALVHAGDSKEELMDEVSRIAKKLLDLSGEDSITIKAPAVEKPFIGICPMVQENGVKLTCITPDSQADKNGLKTGDVITAVNGQSLKKSSKKSKKNQAYWTIMHEMKTGDVLKMEILRSGNIVNLDVTVGSLSVPAYELKVSK